MQSELPLCSLLRETLRSRWPIQRAPKWLGESEMQLTEGYEGLRNAFGGLVFSDGTTAQPLSAVGLPVNIMDLRPKGATVGNKIKPP
jgi:hypothetical protein